MSNGWNRIVEDEDRMTNWVTDRFGEASLNDPIERADRLLEEAVEMQQAVYAKYGSEIAGFHRAKSIIAHVYRKDAGDPSQEIGGIGVCLLALCRRLGARLDIETQRELSRIEGLSKYHFDKRHQAKVDAGVAAQHVRPSDEPSAEG